MPSPKRAARNAPPIVADDLKRALLAVRQLGGPTWYAYMQQLRENRRLHIATWGLQEPTGPTPGTKPIPLKWLHKIADLDKAFERHHAARRGEVQGYISDAVEAEVVRTYHARLRRGRRKVNDDVVLAALRGRDYWNLPHGHKKRALAEIAKELGVSPRTINGIAGRGDGEPPGGAPPQS